MAQLVTADDIQERLLGRVLSESEKATLNVWIADLLSDIRTRISDLNDLAEDADYLSLLKRTIYASVKRVLDNPRGLRQSSFTFDPYLPD